MSWSQHESQVCPAFALVSCVVVSESASIEGAPTPSTDVDLFRIKIWDKATDTMVYDNQMDAEDDDDPTTAIQGGSIKIHKN